ncbi:hypothetical protein D3Z48_05970 [Clostridiaceae bacterium]|nr:hypothetical protein [Clostridiaceae bacterium]
MATGYDGSIRIDTKIDGKGFQKGLESMGSGLKKLAGLAAAAFGTAALVSFGKEAINAASDLSNAWIGLQSIVEGQGRSFSKAKSFIEGYIADGLVPLENAVTSYKNLAARGYDDSQIQQTMTALKDAAAFGRQASYSLGDAVMSATEGLKNENSILVDNAGVTKNVAKMWDDYAKSIGTTANNLTQAQKIQAEVSGILEETKFQAGDAAKVAGTYSGQVSLLAFNFQNLKVAVGNALIPIAQAVLPGINAIISSLTTLANVFAKVTALLFGKTAKLGAGRSSGLSSQVETQKEIASSGTAAADATDKLAAATGGAGSAAKKAAKDMKGVLAPFDELNILADNAADSLSGAAGGLGGAAGDLEVPEIDGGELFGDVEVNPVLEDGLQSLIDRLNELREILKAGFNFGLGDTDFSGLRESLKNIGGYLREIFTDADVQAAAKRFIDSFVFMIGSLAGSLVSVGASLAAMLLGGIEQYLSENTDRIKEWLVRIFDVGTEINNIISEFAATVADVFSVFSGESAQSIVESFVSIFGDIIGGIIEIALKLGRDILDALTAPFIENKDLLKTTLEGFLEPIAQVMQSIKDTVRKAVDEIVRMYDEHIHPFIMSVKESFTEWFQHVLDGFNTYIKPVLDDFAKRFDDVVTNHVQPMVQKAIEFFGKLFDALKLLWDNIFSPLVTWIIDTAMPRIALALDKIGNQFNTWLETVSDVIGGILEALGGVIDFLVGVFTGDWERAWKGLKSIFKGIWDSMVGIVKGVINKIIDALNFVIGKMNLLKFDIPDFVPMVGGESFGINIPKIPHLANGAVIPPNQQFAAILGDQRSGMNLEAPADLIRQLVAEGIQSAGGTGGEIVVNITTELDGRVVARNQVRHINDLTRAAGKPVLLI